MPVGAHAELSSVIGVVDPVVDAPEQAVRAVLGIAPGIAVIVANQLARVCAQVARCVPRQPEVGWSSHENAVLEHLHRARQHQAVHEDGGLVHPPVMIRILEYHDAPSRTVLTRALKVGHEAAHLDDVHPAVGIEVDRDGILHQWLGRHELEPVTVHGAKAHLLLAG